MKKIILLLTFLLLPLFSYKTNIKGIYAIGIFDENGKGENVQHLKKTKADYNGTCYTKIFVYGNSLRIKPLVKIGNSLGYYQSSRPIYNKRKIKIGEEMTFKHYKVSKGLISVSLKNRIFDSKVFVK
jgi:hypothetical protein